MLVNFRAQGGGVVRQLAFRQTQIFFNRTGDAHGVFVNVISVKDEHVWELALPDFEILGVHAPPQNRVVVEALPREGFRLRRRRLLYALFQIFLRLHRGVAPGVAVILERARAQSGGVHRRTRRMILLHISRHRAPDGVTQNDNRT